MIKLHVLLLFFIIFSFYIQSNVATDLCPNGKLQSIGNGCYPDSYMPNIIYDPIHNRFLVSIYNNVQVIYADDCTNFINSTRPWNTNFRVFLNCDGLVGGIRLGMSDNVNIEYGKTYVNIPVVPIMDDVSLSDKTCKITLQVTLFCIQDNKDCYPVFIDDIGSFEYYTGWDDDHESCSFGDLICYVNYNGPWYLTIIICFLLIMIIYKIITLIDFLT